MTFGTRSLIPPAHSSGYLVAFSPKNYIEGNYNYWAHLLKWIEHTFSLQISTYRNSPIKKLCLLLKPLREPPQSVCEGNSVKINFNFEISPKEKYFI